MTLAEFRPIQRSLERRIIAANVIAGAFVLVYLVISGPTARNTTRLAGAVTSSIVFVVLCAVFIPLGRAIAYRSIADPLWLDTGDPTPDDQVFVLNLPWRLAVNALPIWLVVAVGTTTANYSGARSVAVAIQTFVTTLLGGVVAGALSYLLAERALRPLFVLIMRERSDTERTIAVVPRFVIAWVLASALPLIGIALAPIGRGHRSLPLAVPVLFLAAVGLVFGLWMTIAVARSVAEPVSAVSRALRRVRAGDLDIDVPVDHAGEIGLLQSGVNEMAAGLRERQRLQDLFGRHVGDDVARQALERGVQLGGEVRDVTVFFIDLVGSTSLVETRPPADVVTMLNRFFDAVVSCVSAERGWVNKFEGDGALCVFGAPLDQPDHATRALRCVRSLHEAVGRIGVASGIGVATGGVVAGNVGSERRLEYTVIGRPVNQAARLTDAAKTRPSGVLASAVTVGGAGDEVRHWTEAGSVELRGISEPVAVFELCAPKTARTGYGSHS